MPNATKLNKEIEIDDAIIIHENDAELPIEINEKARIHHIYPYKPFGKTFCS